MSQQGWWQGADGNWYPPEAHPSQSFLGRDGFGVQQRRAQAHAWNTRRPAGEVRDLAALTIAQWPRGRVLSQSDELVIGETGTQATILGAKVVRKAIPLSVTVSIKPGPMTAVQITVEDRFPSWAARERGGAGRTIEKTITDLISRLVHNIETAPLPQALPTQMPPWETQPRGWYPDPLQRFEFRAWDGQTWTERVATDGNETVDPIDPSTLRG